MALTYKVLGQSNPAITTANTLYTVPANTSSIISTLAICNQSNTATTFRVALRPAGATLATQHYLNFDTALPANDTITATLGITMATTDVLTVYAGSANVSFSAFGSEIT